MTATAIDPASTRRSLYLLLITAAVAAAAGRVVGIEQVFEPSVFPGARWPAKQPPSLPTLGGNDRSRWATVRALVDEGTYAIGRRVTDSETGTYQDSGIMTEDGWKTLDLVLHPERQEFYSSKPPLLPTLLAGEYWLLKTLFGWSITERPFHVIGTILLTVNVLPLAIYLVLLARLADRLGTSDWGCLYVVTAGCFATFLSTFVITLNNHSIATYSVLFALYPALCIWAQPQQAGLGSYLAAGFFAGFAATNDLPAASFTAALGLLLLARAPGRTLALFAPAAAVPVAALLLTNYLAIGMIRPAYSEVGGPWYEFEGSYWRTQPGQERHGIDWAGLYEGKGAYAFHLLLGHHGLFGLTPIFFLALAGMAAALARPGRDEGGTHRLLAALTGVLMLIVVGFYVYKTGNYGGRTAGPRWLFWLTPLLLLTMVPVCDWLAGRRWGRGLGYVLLALSVFSVSYPAWNPWRHPWLYHMLETQGWIKY